MTLKHKLKQLVFLSLALTLVVWAVPGYAQTKTARGVASANSAIAGVVPEVGNLESQVAESETLMESIEGCAADSRFYDPDTDTCRTADPAEIRFSNSGATQLRIQRPDGSYATYNLDGANGSSSIVAAPTFANCTAPWGSTVLHGASTPAYLQANVTAPATCTSQTRTCNDGTLSGTYTNQNCTVGGFADCTAPWGATVSHGSGVAAYLVPSVTSPDTCTSQTRTCNDGTLSGSYSNQNCVVDPAVPLDCTAPWGAPVTHGSSVFAYQDASVTSPATCSRQTRTCNDGTLSGTFTNQNCNVVPASCMAPWGATVAHGSSVTAYQSATVTSPATCNDETRTCNDGTLSGTFSSQNCAVSAPSCTWRGGAMRYSVQTGIMMAYMNEECGPVNPAPCEGCTTFPFRSCVPNSDCTGFEGQTCLINDRVCSGSPGGPSAGRIITYDRYRCVCR